MAGSGVGRVSHWRCSKFTSADVAAIGLIGERGREVKEFVENTLGEEGMTSSNSGCRAGLISRLRCESIDPFSPSLCGTLQAKAKMCCC